MKARKYFKLYNDIVLPSPGFGTFRLGTTDDEVTARVKLALSCGYRHIDTASAYHFEGAVGEGIRSSGVPRDEIFLTSKVWNTDQGYESTLRAFERSLSLLQTDYLDLYLIHWPVFEGHEHDYMELNIQTWKALEKLYNEKKIRAIGVSNFLQRHLENIFAKGNIKPMVNQLEINPFFQQRDLVDYCKKNDIVVESWGPFKHGEIFKSDILKNISSKYNKNIAQLCLQWCLQWDVLPVCKTSSEERMNNNLLIDDFKILGEDMDALSALDDSSGYYPYELYKIQQAF